MRFKLVDEAKKSFPIHRLCRVLGVSESGYYAWKQRGPSRRQLDNMVLLAHIRSQCVLSHETHGSPPMHVELVSSSLFSVWERCDDRLNLPNIARTIIESCWPQMVCSLP